MENGLKEKAHRRSAGSVPVGDEQTEGPAIGERMTGAEFRASRLEMGLSQQAVADRLGIRQPSVSRIEDEGAGMIVSAYIRNRLGDHREYRETVTQATKEENKRWA